MKTVLLIGASGGIGNKVAEMLLGEGFSVIGTYFNHPERIENLNNDNFKSHLVDLKNLSSIKSISETVSADLYAIVNCAGICRFEDGDLDHDYSIWSETLAVNLSGNYYLAKIFKDKIESNGRFIMISSTDANYGGEITAAYSASKIAVNSLTKSLTLAFRDKLIRVNSVAPGWVLTPMIEDNGEEFLKLVADINPLGRNANPVDIANIISFLLSDKADYINGQVIVADGGYTNQDPTLLLEQEGK